MSGTSAKGDLRFELRFKNALLFRALKEYIGAERDRGAIRLAAAAFNISEFRVWIASSCKKILDCSSD